MQALQCLHHWADQAPDALGLERLSRNEVTPEITSLDILHHQVGLAVIDPVIKNRCDVRMGNSRHELRLAAEADGLLERIVIGVAIQELDDDAATQRQLLRQIRHAHATAADRTEQLVAWDDALCWIRVFGHHANSWPRE